MKIGIIFKKEFHDIYGDKQEFDGMEITISSNLISKNQIRIEVIQLGGRVQKTFPTKSIQLIYFGGWKK